MSDYTYWKNAIKGNFGPVHEGDPQCGYYRLTISKKGIDKPVAIWDLVDEIKCVVGFEQREADAAEIWTSVCQNPISYETYDSAVKTGKFADHPDTPPKTHNLPDDPCEALRIELEGESELAEAFLREAVSTQEQADKAATWSKKLATIAKKADDQRKVEKQPHLDAGAEVDAKWNPIRDDAKDLSTRLKRHLDAWLTEQARLKAERRRIVQAEADRKRIEAEKAAQEAKERNSQAGRTGAKVALRTFVSATITDYDKLLIALKDRQEIKDLVQSLANRAAKSGVELEGMEIKKEKRAA